MRKDFLMREFLRDVSSSSLNTFIDGKMTSPTGAEKIVQLDFLQFDLTKRCQFSIRSQ